MNAWLAGQAQKAQITEAQIQRKRLGIKEAVNYGDINFRVPINPNTEKPYFKDLAGEIPWTEPRSPESAANLTRRLENLYKTVQNTEDVVKQHRIANMMMAKGVAAEGAGTQRYDRDYVNKTRSDLVNAARAGEPVSAGQLHPAAREIADIYQAGTSKTIKADALKTKQAAANRIGGSKLPKALGAAGAVLGLATGAQASDILHGLNPLSVLDSGSLGTDDMMGEPIEFKEPKPKQQKPLAGSEFMFPAKMNENNMMNAWLQSQAQKAELTTTRVQQKRLGIDLNEQLSAKEEAIAKKMKPAMANMIKQYGKEKGTRVFYATVREEAKKKKD